MGVVRICAAGRGSSGTQGGSCTEVQAASKVNGANIPSRAECLRIDEVSGMVMEEKKKRRAWWSFFGWGIDHGSGLMGEILEALILPPAEFRTMAGLASLHAYL